MTNLRDFLQTQVGNVERSIYIHCVSYPLSSSISSELVNEIYKQLQNTGIDKLLNLYHQKKCYKMRKTDFFEQMNERLNLKSQDDEVIKRVFKEYQVADFSKPEFVYFNRKALELIDSTYPQVCVCKLQTNVQY